MSSFKLSIDDFKLLDRLGSGTYATVYKAIYHGGKLNSKHLNGTNENDNSYVAIKCIEKAKLNKSSVENLLKEIEILKSLKHEYIVTMKDFLWDTNYIYIIMEYCNGGDLSRFISKNKTVSEYLAKRFLQQIASALDYMHSKNICHMDLKPHNILLSYNTSNANPILKLADFGFSRHIDSEVMHTKYIIGSPLYMAPEIIVSKNYNEKADLWSVGVILYECLFGKAPFASRTLEEVRDKLYSEAPIYIPETVSPSCHDLLSKLLKRNPLQRIEFEEFVKHSFIDLQRMPSENSYSKAKQLVEEAVKLDKNGNLKEALHYYSLSLQYFIPAIYHEKDLGKKSLLRNTVNDYMKRAEILKRQLYSNQTNSMVKKNNEDQESVLKKLFLCINENDNIKKALNTLVFAHSMYKKEDYDLSAHAYQSALEVLIPFAKTEENQEKKKLLQSEIVLALDEAESAKELAKTSLKNTIQDFKDDSQEKPTKNECKVM